MEIGSFTTEPLKPLKDRKFIQIDRDNFNDVMKRMTPGLNIRVENTLKGDGSELALQLKFNSLEDFEPANVVKQVDPLKKLLTENFEKCENMAMDNIKTRVNAELEEFKKANVGLIQLAPAEATRFSKMADDAMMFSRSFRTGMVTDIFIRFPDDGMISPQRPRSTQRDKRKPQRHQDTKIEYILFAWCLGDLVVHFLLSLR